MYGEVTNSYHASLVRIKLLESRLTHLAQRQELLKVEADLHVRAALHSRRNPTAEKQAIRVKVFTAAQPAA